MRSVAPSRGLALAASLAFLTAAAAAGAQGIPMDRFDPAPAGDRMFDVPSATVNGHLAPSAAMILDYAHDPLVFRGSGAGAATSSFIANQAVLHANATLPLWGRLAFNLEMPFALAQEGNGANVGGQTYASPNKASVGDLRAGMRVHVLGAADHGFQLGLGAYMWIPTAPADGAMGTGNERFLPQILMSGLGDRVVWSFAVGPKIQNTQSFAGVTYGTEVDVGAGVGILLLRDRSLQIGPEVYGAFTVVSDDKAVSDSLKRAANVEILADVRYRVMRGLDLGVGAGPGLTLGLGTPDFRGVFLAAYHFTPGPSSAAPRGEIAAVR